MTSCATSSDSFGEGNSPRESTRSAGTTSGGGRSTTRIPDSVTKTTRSSPVDSGCDHIASRPEVYPPGTTHRIISMEWVPPTEDFPTPDGGGFGFKEPAWAVTIDGPVRGLPGEPSPGPLNMIMVDDASANVWGWTP